MYSHKSDLCPVLQSVLIAICTNIKNRKKKNQQHQQQRHILYFESTQFVRAYKIYGTTTMIVSITFARKLDAAFHLICGTKRKVCQLD